MYKEKQKIQKPNKKKNAIKTQNKSKNTQKIEQKTKILMYNNVKIINEKFVFNSCQDNKQIWYCITNRKVGNLN